MAKEITTTTVETPDPPKPVKKTMTVNERITVARFYGRLVISISAFAIFLYIVHMMLIAEVEMAQSSRDLLNILIGSFISVISGISTFYFNGDSDLMEEEKPRQQQPKEEETNGPSPIT